MMKVTFKEECNTVISDVCTLSQRGGIWSSVSKLERRCQWHLLLQNILFLLLCYLLTLFSHRVMHRPDVYRISANWTIKQILKLMMTNSSVPIQMQRRGGIGFAVLPASLSGNTSRSKPWASMTRLAFIMYQLPVPRSMPSEHENEPRMKTWLLPNHRAVRPCCGSVTVLPRKGRPLRILAYWSHRQLARSKHAHETSVDWSVAVKSQACAMYN